MGHLCGSLEASWEPAWPQWILKAKQANLLKHSGKTERVDLKTREPAPFFSKSLKLFFFSHSSCPVVSGEAPGGGYLLPALL